MGLTDQDIKNIYAEVEERFKPEREANARWKKEVLDTVRARSFAGFNAGSSAIGEAVAKRSMELTPEKCVITIDSKDITGVSRTLPALYEGIAGLAQAAVRVRGLIPSTQVTTGALVYPQESSFTNLAGPVAEGAPKPKSDKTFTPKTLPIETIAHYFKISRQSWDDSAAIQATLENNAVYGVQLATEGQILLGTGTPPQLTGLYPLATATATPPAGDTLIDSWFKAVAQLGAAGWTATGIVTSWADWTATQLLKDLQGRYLSAGQPALPPVIQSPKLSSGQWLVGDFTRGCHIFSRMTIEVVVATQNSDDFERNLLTLRAEERLGLAVWQPSAFLKNAA